MKYNPLILLSALFVLGLSACSTPYFTKPFDEGVKETNLPNEYLGEYKVIVRYIDKENGKYMADTAKGTVLLVSRGVFMNIDSGETVNPQDTGHEDFMDFINDGVTLKKYKNVFYLSTEEKEDGTGSVYYSIVQVKKTSGGLLMKWIDNDNATLIGKLEKKCKKEKMLYTSPDCDYNCNIPVFSCGGKDLHHFFETEMPDSLAVLLVKI